MPMPVQQLVLCVMAQFFWSMVWNGWLIARPYNALLCHDKGVTDKSGIVLRYSIGLCFLSTIVFGVLRALAVYHLAQASHLFTNIGCFVALVGTNVWKDLIAQRHFGLIFINVSNEVASFALCVLVMMRLTI